MSPAEKIQIGLQLAAAVGGLAAAVFSALVLKRIWRLEEHDREHERRISHLEGAAAHVHAGG